MLTPYDSKKVACSTFKDWQRLQDVSQPPDEEAAWNAGRIELQSQLVAAKEQVRLAEMGLAVRTQRNEELAYQIRVLEDDLAKRPMPEELWKAQRELAAALAAKEQAESALAEAQQMRGDVIDRATELWKERDALRARLAKCVEALGTIKDETLLGRSHELGTRIYDLCNATLDAQERT